jgi:CRP/FNR family transcriptional regulator
MMQLERTVSDDQLSADVVGRSPLFTASDDEMPARLRRDARLVNTRGQAGFRAQDRGQTMYVALDGWIKLGKVCGYSRESLVAVVGPGDMFGELSLLDLAPRTHNAAAVTDTRGYEVRRAHLAALLSKRPDVSIGLLAARSQRFRRTNERLERLTHSEVPSRIATNLVEMEKGFGRPGADGVVVEHGPDPKGTGPAGRLLPRDDHRALSEFANRGWVRIMSGGAVLRDVARLRRPAH